MLQSSIRQLREKYGHSLNINLMSVYPSEDKKQVPWDFISIISCKPEQLLFLAFPLAVLYRLFIWCPPIRKLIEKNKIIAAYRKTDLVVDEAGISFVDSRGFVMNTYAFVCAAVPLLVGTPVVKYSQAMGTFKNGWNRFLAKWILPKLKLVIARGDGTLQNLKEIGITENVRLCADGAFTMEDDEKAAQKVEARCKEDSFWNGKVVGLSISSVVLKKCTKLGIDYKTVMVEFIEYLNKRGYGVFMLANAARIHSEKPRNNDLMIGDAIYEAIEDKSMVRWYHEEMDAEEIREYIDHCKYLVASRFHAMIGALQKQVPVLLIGWSHKYQEVLDMFELGQYAADFSKLDLAELKSSFEKFEQDEEVIRKKLSDHHADVMESSRNNIQYISEVIDEVCKKPPKSGKLFDYAHTEKYLGEHIACRMGYAKDVEMRKNVSSGGMVTALLCHLLRTGQIDGAWVTKLAIRDGQLTYDTFIATSEEEIKSASSSVYLTMPLIKHIDMVRKFDGRVAVVLIPCQMRSLCAMLEKDKQLRDKIVLKLGLYCCGSCCDKATLLPIKKQGISLENAVHLYYKRGHWRGQSSIQYSDGSEVSFSYAKTICAYKNAYYFAQNSCMVCQDQYAKNADISFGDIWLKEMKSNPIKHTSCVIRNEKAMEMYQSAVDAGVLVDSHISDTKIIRSQKRALVFKYNLAKAKTEYYKKQGKNIKLDDSAKCKWNHRLAYYLACRNKAYSEENYDKLEKKPMWLIYYYMCFIRALLSF